MDTVEIDTSELTGDALNWAISKVVGMDTEMTGKYLHAKIGHRLEGRYNPSGSWCQGGSLIETHKVDIEHIASDWHGEPLNIWIANGDMSGETALIAACRAIVFVNLGYTVSIPAELMQ